MANEVQDFYESFPFPSKKIPSKKDLYSNAVWVTKLIGKKPTDFKKGEKVLEAGCGTGEFSCGFALGNAEVLGIDLSASSITRAKELAKRFNLTGITFKQMNILENNLPEKSFDYIFSMGVLHHNKYPKKAFIELVKLLKPGGCIVIGLYNSYGRLSVSFRRVILSLFAGKNPEKRIILANKLFCADKPITKQRRIWMMDKYCHPLEKSISFEEVLSWFAENNIEFVSSLPKVRSANKLNLVFEQISWFLKGKSFFTVAGKKK